MNQKPLRGIVGSVGRDPIVKSTSKGDVVKFSVADSDGFGEDKTTTWYEIGVWNEGLQEQILTGDNGRPLIYKGAAVAIHGSVTPRDGYSPDVNAVRVGLVTWLQRSKRDEARPAPVAAAPDSDLDF